MSVEYLRELLAIRKSDRPAARVPEEYEHMLAMIVALTGEVSVLSEKVIQLEHGLAEFSGKPVASLRERTAGPEQAKERDDAREALLERVFQSVTAAYRLAVEPDRNPN
ncbi:MAG: hypothetical protein AAFX58_13190 [Pseudomonadota bacterium]